MKKGITRREREVTDPGRICEILDKSMVLHLGMVDGDEPYVVPMNYGYTMEDGKLTVYLHGALWGRKLDIIRVNPKVFFSLECDVVPFDGDIACRYGTTYASVMGSGIAEIVTDVEEKKKGLWTIKVRCENYVKPGWMIWSPYYCPWMKYETAVRRLDQEAKFNQWKEVKK